ncbi:MAG: DUF3078 domain-containing protein [Saprospiraceae bacterium]
MRNILTLLFLLVSFTLVNAQTLDELKVQKANLEAKATPVVAQADAIKAEIEAVNAKIATFPGWYKGAFGLLGVTFTGRSNWFSAANLTDPSKDLRNSSSTLLAGDFGAFANKLHDKYFWNSSIKLTLALQKLKLGNEKELNLPTPKYQPVTDVLNLNSLFGYKLSSKLAASALGEYRTSVIENFNNPGYLDLGVGVTYTPLKNLLFVFHPLNYNIVFSDDNDKFTPSLGCKILGQYNTEIVKGVKWDSQLSGFFSYKSADPSLHNGTWTNSFKFNILKGIGVGLTHSMRFSPQEGILLGDKNGLQTFYVLGLSYSL